MNYSNIIIKCLSLVMCKDLDKRIGLYVLYYHPSLSCDSDNYKYTAFFFGLPLGILCGLLLPLFLLWILYRRNNDIKKFI